MSYRYYISTHFKRQLKPYLKKHRSLLDDVIDVLKTFDPRCHIALGADIYKIRLKSSDVPKGKSKSFRLIVLLITIENLISPVAIYFKGDQETISKREIKYHIDIIRSELETVLIK